MYDVVFQELGLLREDGIRTATVICREQTELFQIDKEAFLENFSELFKIELNLKQQLARYNHYYNVSLWILLSGVLFIKPLKKGIMSLTRSLGLSVCLSVCLPVFVSVCACLCVCLSVITFVSRWLHSATWCELRSILSTRTRKCNTSQDRSG